MSLSLHAAIIPNRLQIIDAMTGLVDRAAEWCSAHGEAESTILSASLAEGMWGFDRQINSVWMHSAHALDAVPLGRFEPDFSDIPDSFDACRKKLAKARDGVTACKADDLNARAGDDLDFVLGGTVRMSFTVQDFLLSFSGPNFFFHAATAYDILRMKGVEIGKRDFLGTPAIKH